MEAEAVTRKQPIGGSLPPVDNVIQLASNNLKEIPNHYIRLELNSDDVSFDDSSEIPVIDMAKLSTDHAECKTEMARLHQACKEWGYFQLINHGATTAVEKMKVDLQEFFKLPIDQKMVHAQLPNHLEGYGQAFVESRDEKIEWVDMLFLCPLPASGRNMRFWPLNPPSFM